LYNVARQFLVPFSSMITSLVYQRRSGITRLPDSSVPTATPC